MKLQYIMSPLKLAKGFMVNWHWLCGTSTYDCLVKQAVTVWPWYNTGTAVMKTNSETVDHTTDFVQIFFRGHWTVLMTVIFVVLWQRK